MGNSMSEMYRNLPKIDDIARDSRIAVYKGKLPDSIILSAERDAVGALRKGISAESVLSRDILREKAVELAESSLKTLYNNRLRRVINAGGVLIHTNFGRAPMPARAVDGLSDMLTGYTNLEYDLDNSSRRGRGYFAERLVCGLTGAEAAVCVNNNAAAVLIVLNTLCAGKEVILSRGEIVEIGGSFRLSGIIEASGARLKEAGSTNRTNANDYISAINENTGALLKAHTSNFKISGFTEAVRTQDIAEIGRSAGVPTIEDMGSGVLTDLTRYGLPYERQAADAIRDGADIITFSGDKLLGGPQAGIIAGKKSLIDQIRKNPLMRCVRLDKSALYMLENCLTEYCSPVPNIPVLMNAAADTRAKAEVLRNLLDEAVGSLGVPYQCKTAECNAELGGGTIPGHEIDSYGVTVEIDTLSAREIEKRLRNADIPIICRVQYDMVILDTIAIEPDDFKIIAEVFKNIMVI